MSQHLTPEPAESACSDATSRDVLARRRFVRGVFAAPAVMTVCSGSAYAAAVSATCLVRAQGANPPGVSAISMDSESTYLRVRVHELNGVKYVRYEDLTMIGTQGVTSPVPSAGRTDYLELNDNGALTGTVLQTQDSTAAAPTATHSTAAAPTATHSTAAAPTATHSAVVVRFDSDGFVVGTGSSPNSLGALTSMACLMSVTPFR